jgi:Tol biopolymer transport system component
MVVFQTVSGGAIYIINADGSDLRFLTNGMDPALSPDRQWVAFTRWDLGAAGLFVIKTDGTEERQLLAVPLAKAPAWSPDGTKIAISYQNGGHLYDWIQQKKITIPGTTTKMTVDILKRADANWKIAVVSTSDGKLHELYSHNFSYSPTWSADGKTIAYASDKGLSITWEDANSAATRDPNTYTLTDKIFTDRSPAWSPDGTRIVFQYKLSDHSEIMIMNADGSGRTQLTNGVSLMKPVVSSVSPTWSPDGSQIAYLSDANGKWDIWVMDADGGNPHLLFPSGALDSLTLEYNNVDERVLSWR